ncbi:MAG TPA: amino acid permease [Flavobacteriales bacterium]|nr:amino acid permease [Flavobacteriales bacterium]
MANKLFATKSVEQLMKAGSDEGGHTLKRTLTASNLVALGIGAIIGTGIFVLTGTAAANHAGPALTISFIVSGLGCLFAGLCYSEFASMLPISGSAYSYAYATLGEFLAWIIGWDLILEYLFGASTVAVGWSGYMVSFLDGFGIHLPAALTSAPLVHDAAGWHATGAIINLPAVLIVLTMTVLLVRGIRESAGFNNIIVLVKLAVILLFIFFGMWYVDTANWFPYIPDRVTDAAGISRFGWQGILAGAGVIFFAYIGFDAVSTAAQEAKNPQRDMPKGILYSLLVCTILYVIVAAVMTGIVPYEQLNVAAPIALAIDSTGGTLSWLAPWIKVGAIAGLSSVILVMLMGQPRIFFSMSRDGLLPPVFSKVHHKFHTPHVTTILTGSVAAVIAGLFPIGLLGELVSIGTLLAFVIVCLGIIVLRRTRPEMHRPFRTPMVPLVPILGAVICLVQMAFLPWDTWLRLIIWMAIGVLIYFGYGRKHSKLTHD